MKRKRMFTKRCMLVATVLIMLFGLYGCGKKSVESASSDYKKYVYRVTDFELTELENNTNQILKAGDTLYAVGYDWGEDGSSSDMVFSQFTKDGSIEKEYRIEMGSNNLSYAVLDEQENFYCINNVYGLIEGTDEYEDAYFLEKRTLDGELLFSVKMNDIPEVQQMEADYLYVSNMILLPEKGIFVSLTDKIFQFDTEGTFLRMIDGGDVQNGDSIADDTWMRLEDGRVVAVMYEEGGMCVAEADLEKGTVLGEKSKIPGNSYEYSVYPSMGYDLYLVNSYGVYGYNIGDADKTQLMSYIDSDCGFYNVYQVIPLSESEFIGMYNSMDTGNSSIARFTKVPEEEVKEKKVITLACTYVDFETTKAVVRFNKENEEYRISVQDYDSLYNTEEDYSAGLTRLNTDIVSGKMPDILILDSRMPIDSYISKGLFEDLKPYIENDSDMSMDDFMPNIIEAYSVNGKLYRLVPKFSIQTVVAKTAEVGSERGWTVQEAVELWNSKPEGTEFMSRMTREEMLWYCISMSGDQFIDHETGKCNFNSEEFIQILEFVERFPEEIESSSFDDDYWMNYDSMWREDRVLTSFTSLGDFQNYNYMKKGTFGEDITLIGFPSAGGDGSVISGSIELAMSAKSNAKDGVWQFLRNYLLDEYQANSNSWGFPISIRHLDQMAENATKRPNYTDETGNIIEYDDYYYMNGMEIVIDPMTEAEAEEFKKQLYTFDQLYRNDNSLMNIINEETAAYFNGQKKAKDVADVIQSRVQIYVNETR